MSIKVKCPGCGTKLKAPEELVGKKCKCPSCGRILKLEKGGLQEASAQAHDEGLTPQVEREAVVGAAMVEYHNEKWSFSTSYPEGWKILWEHKERPRLWETAGALAGPVTGTGRRHGVHEEHPGGTP